MKILDRYILREFLKPLFYILTGFSMMTIVFDLFGHLSAFMEAQASLILIARYYSCVFLQTLEYILPASLLFATLYTQWRMARSNELTAMRSCGVGFSRIMAPYLFVALTFSIASVILKEVVTPHTTQWAKSISDNKFKIPGYTLVYNIGYYNSIDNREWFIDSIDLSDKWMAGVRVRQERKNNTCFEEIYVKKAKWIDGQWWFFDGYRQPHNADGITDKGKDPTPINAAGEPIPELTESYAEITSEIRQWEYFTSVEMLNYIQKHPGISKEAIASKKTDFHARLALPWASLLVTLFGIPVGAKSSKQNPLTGIFMAVAFFLGFYFLTQFGIFCGKKHFILPWIGAWFSNIVAAVAGITVIAKMR